MTSSTATQAGPGAGAFVENGTAGSSALGVPGNRASRMWVTSALDGASACTALHHGAWGSASDAGRVDRRAGMLPVQWHRLPGVDGSQCGPAQGDASPVIGPTRHRAAPVRRVRAGTDPPGPVGIGGRRAGRRPLPRQDFKGAGSRGGGAGMRAPPPLGLH